MKNCNRCKNKGWVDDTTDQPEIWQYCSCRHGRLLKKKHDALNGIKHPWWIFWR